MLAGATKKVIIIYGNVLRESIPYTLWYGIDATNGKILWEKWAKIDYEKSAAGPFFMRAGDPWTEMADEILLIGKRGQLVLVDALTGEIITQQEKFPIRGRRGHVDYKDILIIGTASGLRAYQIEK